MRQHMRRHITANIKGNGGVRAGWLPEAAIRPPMRLIMHYNPNFLTNIQ